MNTSIAEIESEGGRSVRRGWERISSGDVAEPRVLGNLIYLGKAPERPVSYLFEPPAGTVADTAEYEPRQVVIRDARVMASSLSVHRHGFELWDAPSAVRDFFRDEEVIDRYYPEVAELALAVTGGRSAQVFDHLIRRRQPGQQTMTLGARRGTQYAGPSGRVHNDYTEASGAMRYGLVMEGQSPRGRYCIVNLWRSIGEMPVLDTPLAVCDARTVERADLVASEIRYPKRNGEIYLVRHSQGHAWAYFSEMRREEVLVFKQYDSEREAVARFTPHAAFDHPAMPPEATPRRSIEIRCLVTFE